MQPRHGRPGTRVVFKGKDLDSVSNVKFGEAYADWEPLGIIDEEGKNYVFEIHATVPNNATSARPVLTTSFGDVIIPIQFLSLIHISEPTRRRGIGYSGVGV